MNEEDICRLSLAYAKRHPSAVKFFDSFDDYVQELRLAVIEREHCFNPDKANFSTYCYLCFVNRIRMQVRIYKSNPRPLSLDDIVENTNREIETFVDITPDTKLPTEDDLIEAMDRQKFIDKCFKELSDESIMYFYLNTTQRQIAAVTNRTYQNVGQKIDKDIKRIRRKFVEHKPVKKRYGIGKSDAEAYMKKYNCSIRTYYRHKEKEL